MKFTFFVILRTSTSPLVLQLFHAVHCSCCFFSENLIVANSGCSLKPPTFWRHLMFWYQRIMIRVRLVDSILRLITMMDCRNADTLGVKCWNYNNIERFLIDKRTVYRRPHFMRGIGVNSAYTYSCNLLLIICDTVSVPSFRNLYSN